MCPLSHHAALDAQDSSRVLRGDCNADNIGIKHHAFVPPHRGLST